MLLPRLLVAACLAALLLVVPATASAASGPVKPRIINGAPAAQGQYPWTVGLQEPGADDPYCGGSLIAPTIVLTAAHCTIGSRNEEIEVIAGVTDLDAVQPSDRFEVTKISLHPDAAVGDDVTTLRRDLSLLTLDGDATAAGAQVIGLGLPGDLATVNRFDVSGWGFLTDPFTDPDADLPLVLQWAELDPVSDAACEARYSSYFGDRTFSSTDQICAIFGDDDPATDDIRDTCQGDSGGPLAAPADPNDVSLSQSSASDWRLHGVTSYGVECAGEDEDGPIPGVYARVTGSETNAYAVNGADGTDDSPEQVEHVSGAPGIDTDESEGQVFVFCTGNELTWSGAPTQVDYFIRQVTGDGEQTVSSTGVYAVDESDDEGDAFFCEARGSRPDAGGYGIARSAGIVPIPDNGDPAPQVVEVPVPVPGPVVTVPGPPQVVPVPTPDPRFGDTIAPRTRSVSRRCTSRRVCTFTIRVSDQGAAGVKAVFAQLQTPKTRSCRRGGRRTTCASTSTSFLVARRQADGTYRVVTKRLARGSHVFLAAAVDGAGNIQSTARRVPFTLR